MKAFIRFAAIAALLGGSVQGGAQGLPGGPDPVEGHRLALSLCTPCHVVATDQELPPILDHPAPPFRTIAKRPDTTEASLKHFLLTTHSTMQPSFSMPNPGLADYQVNALVAYLMTLKNRP